MTSAFEPPREWKPASVEDAEALARDQFLLGIAYATPDGRRIDPRDVRLAGALKIEHRYVPSVE